MADDYPNGVAGMPQEETGERSIQSEMVPGAGPVRHTTEAPSREIETETRRNLQHLSLNVEPTTFHRNEPIPTPRSPVEGHMWLLVMQSLYFLLIGIPIGS